MNTFGERPIAQQQQQQPLRTMIPQQFLSMPPLMPSSMMDTGVTAANVTAVTPTATPAAADSSSLAAAEAVAATTASGKPKKRSAKANGGGGGKRAKTDKSLHTEHLPLGDENDTKTVETPIAAAATPAPKKQPKTSRKKKQQQQPPCEIEATDIFSSLSATELEAPQQQQQQPLSDICEEYICTPTGSMDMSRGAGEQAHSFHDFAQTTHMMKLLSPTERDNVLSSLLHTMSPAEYALCMGSSRPATKRRVRDVYQALCYGLNVNEKRAKHDLTETMKKRGLLHMIVNWNTTEKLMLRFREHWYPYNGPLMCEWTVYSVEHIERSLNTNVPLQGIGCHVCIETYIQLYQTGRLFNPIPTEAEQQQKKRNQPSKKPSGKKTDPQQQSPDSATTPSTNTENGDHTAPIAAAAVTTGGSGSGTSAAQSSAQSPPQQQPPKLVSGGKDIANLQRQRNTANVDNAFPDDDDDSNDMDIDSGSEADYNHRSSTLTIPKSAGTAAGNHTSSSSYTVENRNLQQQQHAAEGTAVAEYDDDSSMDDEDDEDDEDDVASNYRSDDDATARNGNHLYTDAAKN